MQVYRLHFIRYVYNLFFCEAIVLYLTVFYTGVTLEKQLYTGVKEMVMTKKVVLVVASKGYQQEEYNETYKVLLKAGVHVTTASDKLGQAVAHDGSTVLIDVSLDALQPALFDGIFLIGGRGATKNKCLDTPLMYRILNEAFSLGKAYGAICVSPRILAHAQVLRGKKATCWDDDGGTKEVFDEGAVTFVHEPVVVDGKVVTANSPLAAHAFGQAILTVL